MLPLSRLLDLLYPRLCCACGWPGSFLCWRCYEQIDFFPLPLALPPELATAARSASPLTSLHAVGEYDGPLSKLIHTLKYQGIPAVARTIAELIYETTCLPDTTLITFVPMHPKKQKERGFNQTQLVATELGQLMQKPVVSLLTKTIDTTPQAASTTKHERLTKANHAFAYTPPNPLPFNLTQDQPILLLDDVITTGATLVACATTLQAAGHTTIHALALAHGG